MKNICVTRGWRLKPKTFFSCGGAKKFKAISKFKSPSMKRMILIWYWDLFLAFSFSPLLRASAWNGIFLG
jgi:hypothetical protein